MAYTRMVWPMASQATPVPFQQNPVAFLVCLSTNIILFCIDMELSYNSIDKEHLPLCFDRFVRIRPLFSQQSLAL